MDSASAIELARSALVLVLTIVGPMLIASLIVGVLVGLLQALTQVQEMTLTFVPKLLVLGVVLLLSLPMIGHALSNFMERISDIIIAG
ncbi:MULTISPECIES: flagellar biosynthetic protein FliQ [Sphingomonadaceae]|jgi:flagellar biosynthetic protein FliQ|uniref:Flagellar biosynthetic protein FliQ n=1 Tax=Novosphingobium clariflavum TaxID=2029884 RepID=A0ABV6SB62_9SPHN|nr:MULTISPECIES: flagellar biosynthetic protein FliQ [Sphingomonadaceae]QDK31392.1 flagellar biosynthetic protein FliQ [Sphingomonas sp. IC081]QSR16293.1 flagellar biosynthetic protein FliQ [Novosphingobium sp. KA1]